jgi:hypothetical protein
MTTPTTQTLADWLLWCIAFDERSARVRDRYGRSDQWHRLDCELNSYDSGPCDCGVPDRVLAECAAKRRIVELHSGENDTPCQSWAGNYTYEPCPTLRALASVYADHPEFREEWRA